MSIYVNFNLHMLISYILYSKWIFNFWIIESAPSQKLKKKRCHKRVIAPGKYQNMHFIFCEFILPKSVSTFSSIVPVCVFVRPVLASRLWSIVPVNFVNVARLLRQSILVSDFLRPFSLLCPAQVRYLKELSPDWNQICYPSNWQNAILLTWHRGINHKRE